jgi:hypothetical protein
MKTSILFISIIFILHGAHSQQIETIGAGVIDFLLTNPKTANQVNPTETAALKVIGNLLNISAERKHDLNVANAGRSEIVINTSTGAQATMYSDNQGNLYLLYNGKIYPISSTLVNQARNESKTINNATLSDYDLSELDKKLIVNKEYVEYLIIDGETVNQIANKFNISTSDIYFKKLNNPRQGEFFNAHQADEKFSKKLHIEYYGKYKGYFYPSGWYPMYSTPYYTMYLNMYKTDIKETFTCNWAKDFNNDGFQIDDFQNIKRSFYEGERIQFFMVYSSESSVTWQFEVYDNNTGKSILTDSGIGEKGARVFGKNYEYIKFPPGIYLYTFRIDSGDNKRSSKSEKFEILHSEQFK